MSSKSLTVKDALQQVSRYQSAGQLAKAEALCAQILKAYPGNPNAIYFMGVLCLQQGKFRQSRDALQRFLKLNTKSAEAYANLGAACIHLGHNLEAEENLEKAIELNPKGIPALLNLSTARANLENNQGALQAAEQAYALAPNNERTCTGLAIALLGTNQFRSARELFNRSLKLNPKALLSLNNLSEISLQEGRYSETIDLCARANAIAPNNPSTLRRKSQALAYLGKNDEAVDCLQPLSKLKDEYILALRLLVNVFRIMGETERAVTTAETALRIAPENPEIMQAQAAAFVNVGDDQRALEIQRKILELNPLNVHSLYAISGLTKIQDGDAELESLNELAASELSDSESYRVDFALARVYKSQKRTADFVSSLTVANEKKKVAHGYSLKKDIEQFDRIRKLYATIQQDEIDPSVSSNFGRTPLFVVGMPRSGTTLTEQILSAHSEVYGAGELRIAEQSLRTLFVPEENDTRALSIADVETAAKYCYEFTAGLGDGERYFVDKMPLNFRYVGYLSKIFPRARFINLDRDPRAVCWSIYSRSFAGTGNDPPPISRPFSV